MACVALNPTMWSIFKYHSILYFRFKMLNGRLYTFSWKFTPTNCPWWQSESTLHNYMHHIALVSLHFKRLPEGIWEEKLTEYLTGLALPAKSPSRSAFKHTVYGLHYYRHFSLSKLYIDLPTLEKELKLPVILNLSEPRELLKLPHY